MESARPMRSVSEKLVQIIEDRPSSAQGNLQSHPCFQASLFNDNERAIGSFDEWYKRTQKTRANAQSSKTQKDFQLEQIIWSQSVNFDICFLNFKTIR